MTWKDYDDLLERTHVAVPSPAFESNRLKRLTTYPKRFLADTAFALALAGLDAACLVDDPTLAGPYVESSVMQQLRPQIDGVGGTLSHLRTGAGQHEIDAIVEIGLDDRFVAGFVVHTGGDTASLGDRIWAIPVHLLGR